MVDNIPNDAGRQSQGERLSIGHRSAIEEMGQLAVSVSRVVDKYASVYRIPRLSDGSRESNIVHSFHLATMAIEIDSAMDLGLDPAKLEEFARAHDLLELKVGDVATFDLTDEEREEKERREHEAKESLVGELQNTAPQMAKALIEYELQNTPEAVFIRMVDKLLPIAVDITGDGMRIMREDYGIKNLGELHLAHSKLHASFAKKFGESEFPWMVDLHAELCALFEDKYQRDFDSELNRSPDIKRGPVETERKWLINIGNLPANLDLELVNRSKLRQGYLAIGADGSETRVRDFGDGKYQLTAKASGAMSRDEQNMDITREQFDALWPLTQGRRVEKTRYYIPHGAYMIELDVYGDSLTGLSTAEVEFSGRQADAEVKANTFKAPHWFGDDVTDDLRYKNNQLAINGVPPAPMELGNTSI